MKMILIKYIINNIVRKKKQTIFCFSSIFVPSLIILTDYAIINGIEGGLKRGIDQVISGQLLIVSGKNNDINILESQLNEQELFINDENNLKELETIFPAALLNRRVRLGALVSYGSETSYANVHALEDNHLRRIGEMLSVGKGRMPEKGNEMIISKSLAQNLLCGVGDTLLLLATNVNDYMSDALGVVSGIFEEKGLAVFLNYTAFIPYRFGQEIAEIPEGQAVELIVNHAAGKDFTREEIRSAGDYFKASNPALTVATWRQTVPLMSAIVNVWKGGGVITQIVFISFSLIILVTLTSLVVRSRRKETGTLLAIGFSWTRISLLLCFEYLLITFISVTASYLLLHILLASLPPTGIEITSEYMQAALMAEKLQPVSAFTDFLYVAFLFGSTATLSALISIRKLKKMKIHSLITN
ncbi:MAG: FtsX-like permease family protein [Tannerellaceae bacterium]|jgi:ABC-type lipoprotein release transport system permease subunit|nr:FtsX-like permease family protein [Tannerellaceae bacterium]